MKKWLFLFCIIVMFEAVCITYLYTVKVQHNTVEGSVDEKVLFQNTTDRSASGVEEVSEEQAGKTKKSKKILKKYASLFDKNNDMVGYIYLNSSYSFPVLQRKSDQNFYSDHNFNGQSSIEGSIFANRHTELGEPGISIIYGHRLKSGSMFSSLKYYIDDKEYIKNNKVISIDTLYEKSSYSLVAVALVSLNDGFDYYKYAGNVTESEFEEWKKYLGKKCIRGSLDSLGYGDVVAELSTCSYHTDKGREVVIFKKL